MCQYVYPQIDVYFDVHTCTCTHMLEVHIDIINVKQCR